MAFATQKWQERLNRFGSRYTEYLRSLGVTPADSRLQRPEYLGGGSQTIQFSEVLNTSDSNTGALAGHGIAGLDSNRYRRMFTEHGILMSIVFVRPKSIYEEGMERFWFKNQYDDFWQPQFQHIGSQELYNGEVSMLSIPAGEKFNDVWGYQDRYDEYRFKQSRATGEFVRGATSAKGTKRNWNFNRRYSAAPMIVTGKHR